MTDSVLPSKAPVAGQSDESDGMSYLESLPRRVVTLYLPLFVILIDSRRGVEDEERQLYEWLGTEHVPAQIVLTKVDKLSATERGLLKERSRKSFGRRAPILVYSESGEGLVALWSAIFEAVSAVGEEEPASVEGS